MGDRRGGRPADAVIVGGGPAGHFLARALIRSRWGRGAHVVLVDPAGGDLSGRRWAYWSAADEPEAWRSWDRLHVHAAGRDLVVSPRRHRYLQVRGEDLTAASRRAWGQGIEVVAAAATSIEDTGECALVTTDAGEVRARWVFDSVLAARGRAATSLWFAGEVRRHGPGLRSPEGARDAATIIDDRLSHRDVFGFGYLLPLTPDETFVEVTCFAPGPPQRLAAALTAFGAARMPGSIPTGVSESGRLLLAKPSRRRRSPRVMSIGAAAGAVRASTGYGLTRMRADAAAIAAALDRDGRPFRVPALWPRRHVLADAVLLELVRRDPTAVSRAFAAMFADVDPDVLLDFLDGTTSPRQERAVLTAVPQAPFRRAALACLAPRRLRSR